MIDGQPVVAVPLVKVEQPDFVVFGLAAAGFVANVDAFYQEAVKGVVVVDEVGGFMAGEFANGFVDGSRA